MSKADDNNSSLSKADDNKSSLSKADDNSKPPNTSAWTPEEDQILFDGLLIGNLPQLYHKLEKGFGRTQEDVDRRTQELMPVQLPECWCSTRQVAYDLVRERTHDGEPALSKDEWKELVLWIHNGYVGINPSRFHWTRSTERLRQEVRIFDEMNSSTFERVAKAFAAEKASNPPKKLGRGLRYHPKGPPPKEVKERRDKRHAEEKEKKAKSRAEAKEHPAKSHAEAKEKKAKSLAEAKEQKVKSRAEAKEQKGKSRAEAKEPKAKSQQEETEQSDDNGVQPQNNNEATGKRKRDSSDDGNTNDEKVKKVVPGTY